MAESTISSPDIAPRAGLSQVRGADAPPLSNLTIAELLAQSVARFGDRPAAVFREQGIRWSWNEFAAEVEALAAGLRQLGLKTGDRLGIWSPNRSEWVVTQFATAIWFFSRMVTLFPMNRRKRQMNLLRNY